MDQTLLIIMAVFVAIAAIAMVFQAAMLYGVSKSTRAMQEQVNKLAPEILSVAKSSKAAIEEGRASIAEITARSKEILDTTQRQLNRVDRMMEDVSERARVQFDRAELVIDDAMSRAQQVVSTVHGGIMKPIREINGVASGVRAAIEYFMRGTRPTPDRATMDEEMFI